jgi:hypothetical protein
MAAKGFYSVFVSAAGGTPCHWRSKRCRNRLQNLTLASAGRGAIPV